MCAAIAKSGKPCRQRAVHPSPLCDAHNPDNAEKWSAAGRIRHRQVVDIAGVPVMFNRSRTIPGIVDALIEVADLVHTRALTPSQGSVKVAAYKAAAERLEKAEERKRAPRGALAAPPSPHPTGDGSSTASPSVGLIGEMVAEHHRSKSGSSVQ
jgi:hypothetical protein